MTGRVFLSLNDLFLLLLFFTFNSDFNRQTLFIPRYGCLWCYPCCYYWVDVDVRNVVVFAFIFVIIDDDNGADDEENVSIDGYFLWVENFIYKSSFVFLVLLSHSLGKVIMCTSDHQWQGMIHLYMTFLEWNNIFSLAVSSLYTFNTQIIC